jgi:hypothetical protein
VLGVAVAGLAAALAASYAGARAHALNAGAHFRITTVVRGDPGAGTGVASVDKQGRKTEMSEGADIPAGARVETDPRTRVRLAADDGTVIALDRASSVGLEAGAGRTLSLTAGSLVADVASGTPLVVATPLARITAGDARIALTVDDDRTTLEVGRGDAEMAGPHEATTVHAGEEAALERLSNRVEIAAANDMAQRVSFGEGFDKTSDEKPLAGLGSLRARKPGSKDEVDGAVRLSKHDVRARIAGAMARTEVDETFVNTTDQELEGVWRFPLPPDARLERLALEVDGHLEEGEFVDSKRASGIWRGVIQHAAPTAPKPVEEIVWVPGPWRDPALLEWQRGGRAELKIFPIPRRGTRRVVVAYTQHVAPVGSVRRWVYPLPPSGIGVPVDTASFDVRVAGAVAGTVRGRGYTLADEPSEDRAHASRLSMTREGFVPSGDLVVEYASPDTASEATATAFAPASGEDAFVALALRPRLPPWTGERSRDQVIVVDSGRSMFGERLRRAERLAGEITQNMDRRDRVTVLACDVECRAMPGGWHAPGAGAAHDVDEFFAGLEADGASDLVGAIRTAARAPGRARSRELRVVLLSDGVASAGYSAPSRVASEVAEALPDGRAEVVAVPIGSDADVDVLGEIARGGGGAVVPYAPGESLESAALGVLGATYGAMLRDVQIVLPEGLYQLAPATVAPMRAGGETMVAARLRGDHAQGDVVLRGTLAGEPFEARWPIDVHATGDEGNAWAARAWASMRVADDERTGDGDARTEAVSLSHRFRVPSRFTSLLVLESEAMFHAFGIERAEHAFEWSGESEGASVQMGAIAAKEEAGPKDLGGLALPMARGADKKVLNFDESASEYGGGGGGGFARMRAAPASAGMAQAETATPAPAAPAATASAMATAPLIPPEAPRTKAARLATNAAADEPWMDPNRHGRWMQRVWFRTAAITPGGVGVVDAHKLEAARAAVAATPDARQAHEALAKLLVQLGDAGELDSLAREWSSRDPLDADAIALRATVRARRGDRDGALHVFSGVLSSLTTSTAAQGDVAKALARAEERAGHPDLACALSVAAAERKPADPDAVGAAVACERASGKRASEARWLASMKDDAARARVAAAAAKTAAASFAEDPVKGDVVVDATWDPGAGADLDLAVVDPSGHRLSWASAASNIRASDCTSLSHEALGVSSMATGPFVVEVARANAGDEVRTVTGTLRITSLGHTQLVPFVLSGDRTQAARVDVRLDSRLVAVDRGIAMDRCDPPFYFDARGIRRMKPECNR